MRIFSPRLPHEHHGKKKAFPAGLSKTRRTGINPKRHEDFPWVLPTEDRDGMLCSLCCKHCRRSRKSIVGKAVWTDVLCRTITQQALVKHGQSESHIDAVKLEAALSSSHVHGGIDMAFERVVSAERHTNMIPNLH